MTICSKTVAPILFSVMHHLDNLAESCGPLQ